MNDTPANLRKVLDRCLREGGRILERGFGRKQRITKKSAVSIVTETDKAAERHIISTIHQHFPAHGILAEESSPIRRPGESRWIIDPLDGTTNFAHSIPLCCVSIGVERDGKVLLGGIYNPFLDEFFFAERGKGAYLNGKRILVSKQSVLIDSLLVTGFPYDRQEKAAFYLKFFRAMMEKTQGLRRLGAAALDLAYVACGRFEAFWEFNLKSWDIAAGSLLVEEAGGKVTDFRGKPLNLEVPAQLLASNSRVHPPLLKIFNINLGSPLDKKPFGC